MARGSPKFSKMAFSRQKKPNHIFWQKEVMIRTYIGCYVNKVIKHILQIFLIINKIGGQLHGV